MNIENTKKGQGSKLIEDQRLWHYRVPDKEVLDEIKKDLNS